MKPNVEVYEIPNTFTPEMPLDEQIAHGCNDWMARGPAGEFFGRTQEEAIQAYERALGR